MQKTVKKILVRVFRLFNKREAIIFESTPDFSDNTYAVFQEMVKQELGQKYTLVWSCSKDQILKDTPDGVKYIQPLSKRITERFRNAYYLSIAKCMICCNRFLQPWAEDQTAFYLAHGTSIKNVRGYFNLPKSIHYCLSAAVDVEEMTAYQLCVTPEKMFSLGYPRNDILTCPPQPIKPMLETDCKKVVVWYPTFRQHKNGLKTGASKPLPIIHNQQAAIELNDWAQNLGVLIVLKPHFAQDLSGIKDLHLSNIYFIDESFFQKHNISSYGFVAGCDALITDYSSIYFDFMLTDKPVGLVWEDIEEYRENPGFAIDIDKYGKGGVKIYTLEDFKKFLEEVAQNIDSCQAERRVLRDLVNYSNDGGNAERVAAFIIDKAKL